MKNLKALIITTVALQAGAAFAQENAAPANVMPAPVAAAPASAAAMPAPAAAAPAMAAPAAVTPGIDANAARQQQRIQQGVQSGQLNAHEANRLEHQQAVTTKMEDKAKADGKVTKKERKKIKHHQKKTSKHIRKQKHDAQTAAPATVGQ